MADLRIEIDLAGIDDFGRKMQQLDLGIQTEVMRALDSAGALIKADAQTILRANAYRTGFLASTVYAIVRWGPPWLLQVGALAWYAVFHERGTRPHAILPKKPGGVLRFESKGKVVYARRVWHPGIRAVRFLSRAVRQRWPMVRDILRRAIILAKERAEL